MRNAPYLLFVMIPLNAFSQGIPVDDPGIKGFGRLSFTVEKALREDLAFRGGCELRAGDALFNQIRADESLGIVWSATPWLQAECGYTFIGKCDYRHDYSLRHRVTGSVAAKWKEGPWCFTVKEKVQLTHRPGEMNTWQQPRNQVCLKSKAQVEYVRGKHWRPLIAVEVKMSLNAVKLAPYDYYAEAMCFVTPSGDIGSDPGWMTEGFDQVTVNRLRLSPGVKYRISRHKSLRFYVLADYRYDRKIDISSDGTRLKSIVDIPEYDISSCLAYVYHF